MKPNYKTQIVKLAIAGVLIALGAVLSGTFSFPIGTVKCAPFQHMINVLAGVILGPWYAVGMAFITSLLRLANGTGTLFAFPGSMIGALCCGLAFRYILAKKSMAVRIPIAVAGEVIGTGLIGAMATYPIALFILGNTETTLFANIIPFLVSTAVGSAIAAVLLTALLKTGIIAKLNGSGLSGSKEQK